MKKRVRGDGQGGREMKWTRERGEEATENRGENAIYLYPDIIKLSSKMYALMW